MINFLLIKNPEIDKICSEKISKCAAVLKKGFTQLSEKVSTIAKETFATLKETFATVSDFITRVGNTLAERAKTLGFGSGTIVSLIAFAVVCVVCPYFWPILISSIVFGTAALIFTAMAVQTEMRRIDPRLNQ